MPDLRALLGDRYETVIEQAWQSFLTDGSGLGTRVDLTKALEAVLPELLADVWDKGADFVVRHPGVSAEYTRTANPFNPTATSVTHTTRED